LIVAYVTCATEEEARKIAFAAVNARLAACANYWQGSSVFKWKGRTRRSREWFLLLKTSEAKRVALRKMVEGLHSYEVPAILFFKPFSVNKAFVDWVAGETAFK